MWGKVVYGRQTFLPISFPDRPHYRAARNGGQGGGRKHRLLFCDSHCSRNRGLAHVRAAKPTGASRRGRGISPGLAREWIGLMKLRLYKMRPALEWHKTLCRVKKHLIQIHYDRLHRVRRTWPALAAGNISRAKTPKNTIQLRRTAMMMRGALCARNDPRAHGPFIAPREQNRKRETPIE